MLHFLLGAALVVGAGVKYLQSQHEKVAESISQKYRLTKRSKERLDAVMKTLQIAFVGAVSVSTFDNQPTPETLVLIDWADVKRNFDDKADTYSKNGFMFRTALDIAREEYIHWSRSKKSAESDDFKMWSQIYEHLRRRSKNGGDSNYQRALELLED